MELKKITAIIRHNQLQAVENRLKGANLPGMTVDDVRGYGEYVDFFSTDWMSRYARLEIVIDGHRVLEIADAISEVVHTGAEGDGFVYVVPVDRVYRTRDRHLEKSVSSCPHCRAAERLRRRRRRATPVRTHAKECHPV